MNYFILNNINSLDDLDIRMQSPVLPDFLRETDSYTISLDCFHIYKENMDNYITYISFLRKKLYKSLKNDNKLTFSMINQYFFEVLDIEIIEKEYSSIGIKFNIIFHIRRYKNVKNGNVFINHTFINNKIVINNDYIKAYPIFKISSNISKNITIKINSVSFILRDVLDTVYLDFDLKEYYNDVQLLNSKMSGTFFNIEDADIIIESSDIKNIKIMTNFKDI